MAAVHDPTEYVRREKYDPLNGKWLRETLCSDVVVIGGEGSQTATGDFVLQTVTTDSDVVLYPYLFVAEASSNDSVFAIVVGNSTQHSLRLTDSSKLTEKIEMRPDAPITKVEANSSVSVVGYNPAGTIDYQAFLTCKREPTPANKEPNLF